MHDQKCNLNFWVPCDVPEFPNESYCPVLGDLVQLIWAIYFPWYYSQWVEWNPSTKFCHPALDCSTKTGCIGMDVGASWAVFLHECHWCKPCNFISQICCTTRFLQVHMYARDSIAWQRSHISVSCSFQWHILFPVAQNPLTCLEIQSLQAQVTSRKALPMASQVTSFCCSLCFAVCLPSMTWPPC